MIGLKYLFIIIILAIIFRFPNFLGMMLGTSSVIAIWWFVSRLFPQSRFLKEIAALFLAISPWHITLTNYSWKINLSILVTLLGSIILMEAIRNQRWLAFSFIILIVATSQLYKPFELGFSNTKVPVWLTDEQRREHGREYNNWETKFFHNKVVNYSLSFFEHYSEHFSGDFLFIVGDTSLDKKFSGFGLMYLFDILFLLIGFCAVIRKFEWNNWGIIFLWLILSPINSAFTFNPPSLLRSALMVVPLIIISSVGALILFKVILLQVKRLYN